MSETPKTRQRIAERLEQAGVNTERFVQCRPGSKASVDHTRQHYDDVEGEYGIYATKSDGLVIIDIDDYDELEDRSGLTALMELEPTLEQSSPHGGTHRFYVVEPSEDGRMPAEVFDDELGVQNPKPSYGEVRVSNQYVVGAGSQLDGCDKDWCSECEKPDGGLYELSSDRRIATHTPDEMLSALLADPNIERAAADDVETEVENFEDSYDEDDRLDYALKADEKLRRLWNGDYSDYSGSSGVDRSEAESALAMKLGWWFQGDKTKVRQLMDRADTKKWVDREDSSYRDSILSAVDELTDYYEPDDGGRPDPRDLDPKEVERGKHLLQTQTGPENPPGELEYHNGGYGYEKVYKDDDGNVTNRIWGEVCNFRLKTLSYLSTDRGEQIKLRVIPKNPREEPYDVRIEPTVFNSPQTFKEEVVVGRTTWFDSSNPKQIPSQTTLGYLRELVGSQPAPNRTGTEFIGLSPDREEWVTPAGSIGEDGWLDDPEYEFYSKGGGDDDGGLAQKWQLDPETNDQYDQEEVKRILELLPKIRKMERGLPILGWFYAAPLKPYIHDDFGEGEFNMLQVYADSGAGKTATIQAFWMAFGSDPNPFSASDTAFTIEKHMTESAGMPVWYDEFKPTDMAEHKLKRLRDTLRKLTRESSLSKGTADLDEITFQLRAPVVISGEQQFNDTAVRRRSVMTNLSTAATEDGSQYQKAFGELTGASYTSDGVEEYPDGCDLKEHARAYFEYLAGIEKATLHEKWREARETVTELLTKMGVSADDSEQQGLQTVAFGVDIYRDFARSFGVSEEEMPTEADVADAIAHVVENIGKDGNRREHADEFMELLTGAAREDYIEEGVHYRVIDSRTHNQEVLAVHMPSAFNSIKKYLREFNLEDEYAILSRDDYLTSFGNKAEQDGSYVFATNKKTRNLANGSKAVHFDPWRAESKLGGDFQLGAFTEVDDAEDEDEAEGDDDGPSGTSITELSPGYQDLKVEVASSVEPKPWLEAEGTLRDESGVIDFVARGSTPELEEGATYYLQQARVEEGESGLPQVEIRDGVTQIKPLEESGSQSQLSQPEAAADGGVNESQNDRVQACVEVVDSLATESEGAAKEDIVVQMSEMGYEPNKAESTVQNLKQNGTLYNNGDGIRVSRD